MEKKTVFCKIIMVNIIFSVFLLITGCAKDSDAEKSIAVIPQTKPVTYFDAELDSRGDLSAYGKVSGSPYTAMVIDPSRITVVNDPVYGSKRKAMLMDVRTSDNAGVTENPRAQVQTPMSYMEGQTVYIGFSVRFTSTLWTYFLTFSELYGAPYYGTSPFRLSIQGSDIVASATADGKQTNLWKEPLQAGIWYDFVYSEALDRNATKGELNLWYRKQGDVEYKKIIVNAKMATVTTANVAGPNYHKLACYYDMHHTYTDASKKVHVTDIKMYFANHKVGNSFALVAPAYIK